MKRTTKEKLISQRENPLIDVALGEFLLSRRAANRSERTIEFYETFINRFIWWAKVNRVGDRLNDYHASHVRSFLSYLKTSRKRWASKHVNANKMMADSSVQAYFRALRAFFNYCGRDGMVEENPFASGTLETPKAKEKIVPSYSPNDIERILKACQVKGTYNGLRDQAIIYVLLDTGIRASELCGIRLDDLELDDTGRRHDSRVKILAKGNKERYASLAPLTEKAIRDYIRKGRLDVDGYLFLGKGERGLTSSGLYQMIERRAKMAGVNKKGVHRWRHTFALEYSAAGGPLHGLQSMLGHASPTMSLKYGKMASTETKELHRQYSPVERMGRGGKR